MHHRLDLAALHQPVEEHAVADIADDELGLARHRPVEAGRQIVEHDDALAAIDELQDHVAADIAAAAGDQNAHRRPIPASRGLWTDR